MFKHKHARDSGDVRGDDELENRKRKKEKTKKEKKKLEIEKEFRISHNGQSRQTKNVM